MQNNLFFDKYKDKISKRMQDECDRHPDPAHDFLHVKRVVKWAEKFAIAEGADLNVVLPAAYLHDVVVIAKNDPRRSMASRLSADEAIKFLDSIQYPKQYLDAIHHAIAAHSFSAKIEAKALEAMVVQDADRVDGLGAIGIARCFSLSGALNRIFYHEEDLLAEAREPNDYAFTLDHFFVKLLKVPDMMRTESGKREAQRRLKFLKDYLNQLKEEVSI